MAKSASTVTTYEFLTADERERMLEGQLLAFEREHFSLTQLIRHDPNTPGPGTDRVDWLESEIVRLRALRGDLTSATSATPSA